MCRIAFELMLILPDDCACVCGRFFHVVKLVGVQGIIGCRLYLFTPESFSARAPVFLTFIRLTTSLDVSRLVSDCRIQGLKNLHLHYVALKCDVICDFLNLL